MNIGVQSSIQELKNEVHELKSELKEKDANIKIMTTLLAQVLTNSSLPAPPEFFCCYCKFLYHITLFVIIF